MQTATGGRRFVYDAFGRLTRVEQLVGGLGEDRIAQYKFNGLGYRIMTQTDADFDGVFEDGERTYLMYDERWRVVASFVDASATPKEAFIYHAAGLAGRGRSSYIDSVILRDRDNAGDSALEERRVYLQNWRADVVAVTRDDGLPIEYVRYSSYGEATVYPVADVNRDGVVNATDATDWNTLMGGGTSNAAVDLDLDRDGNFPDPADSDLFDQSYAQHSGLSGVGRVSSASLGNRKGYAGYEWDETISVYHVRHRVYLPEIGRWSRRDPLGYVDGMSLYEYVSSAPTRHVDPIGLINQNVCNSENAPDIIIVCRDDDDGPNKDVPACIPLSPGQCADKEGGPGDWEFIIIPFGPAPGWYQCRNLLSDCDPKWWQPGFLKDDNDGAVRFRTPLRRFSPRWRDYIFNMCTLLCSGGLPMTSDCATWTSCMNTCLDNRGPGQPIPDEPLGPCPYAVSTPGHVEL